MKSLQKSEGKNSLVIRVALVIVGVFAISCASRPGSRPTDSPAETSLAGDNQSIEALRNEIPVERREENDQLKQILNLTQEVVQPPGVIRDRYNRLASRMREQQRRDARIKREQYNRKERKERDEFFKKLKDDRDGFLKNKRISRELRQQFFSEQDISRRQYTADERDRRQKFNADLKIEADDFFSRMRMQDAEFGEALKLYTERFNEKNKPKTSTLTTGP